jgi:putative aldouronate transport system permease protein
MISMKDVPNISVRMAIAVIAVLPLLIAYPFFQKYFVKGITLGSVKG